jgi:hypothetical protein
MAYTVDTTEPVKAYLRTLSELSREGRLKLVMGYLDALRERGDELRLEPSARYPGSSSLFTFRHVFRDGGRTYIARFIVDDSAAVYGVLRVVYADLMEPQQGQPGR